jgi:hypothetical protein
MRLAQAAPRTAPAGFSDAEIKAALVHRFIVKTEWPAEARPAADGALTVGVVGAPAFARALRTLTAPAGKESSEDKTAEPRLHVVELDEFDDVLRCQVIYFGQNDRTTRSILAKVAGQPVLTVGEGREFTEAGGVFGFERVKAKVRYWFSGDAMGRANLRVDVAITTLQLKPGNRTATE